MKRLLRAFLLAVLAVSLLSGAALAYLYRAPIAITENASTDYSMLPVLWDQNNTWLASNGFMATTANDTRVQTLGGLNRPWMVADNKTLVAIAVDADSQTNLYFTTGESEASAMDIIVGYGGSVNVTDDPALEISNNGSVAVSGYIDTSASMVGENITSRGTAYRSYIGSTGNVTAQVGNGAFPVVDDIADSTQAGASPHSVTLPAGYAAGDIIIVNYYIQSNAVTASTPAGWTELFNQLSAGNNYRWYAWYKVADGTEGATLSVTQSGAATTYHTASGISGGGGVERSTIYTHANTNLPNPPSLTPSYGGTRNYLWIADTAYQGVGAARSVSSYSAGYTGHQYPAGVVWYSLTTSYKNGASTVEDPGVVTYSGGADAIAVTYAIFPLTEVSATVSSGSHAVVVSTNATSGDLELWVDGAKSDNMTLAGAAVPDTTDDWVFMSNATPYLDYVSISVNGTQQLYYAPNDIIAGTNLPDREGSNNGTITWGANPAGIGATISSMTSSGQSSATTVTGTPSRDVLTPDAGTSSWSPGDGTITKAATLANPFRVAITAVSDNTTLSEVQVWRMAGAALLLLLVVLVGSRLRGHVGITVIIASVLVGGMVVFDSSIFPWWLLMFSVGGLIIGIVAERSPSL